MTVIAEKISHYRILEKLGEGGMGEIYLAEDTVLGRQVAVKFLSEKSLGNERASRRLIKEAQAAAVLDHANICSIYEAGEEGGQPFIIMQYVKGETLDSKIDARALDLNETIEVAVQVADALAEAHSHGIIHRDIKPQNIMITARGQAKVMDFGLAKVSELAQPADSEADTQSLLTDPGVIIGTIPYMSPEQIRSEQVDDRSDIFSFGTMLYEMVTGRHPFASPSQGAMISAILTHEPPPLTNHREDAPEELDRIVHKCLEKDRKERYQSASELLSDLKALQQSISSGLLNTKEVAPPRTTLFERYALAAIAAALVLALAGFGLYRFFAHADDGEISSIAVLPFINADADQSLDYLSDGITDSLISSLSQLPHLKVIARSSVFRYKGKEVDPQAVANELKVQSLLMGTVTNHNGKLLIKVELVDPRDRTQIWYVQYTRDATDAVALQKDFAHVIVDKLRPQMTGDEQKRFAKPYTDNTEAYQLYLKGRYFYNKGTTDGWKKSIEFFNQALSLDSRYALAYAGLADSYAQLGSYGYNAMLPTEAMRNAESSALNALAIDNTLAEAHTSLGIVKLQYSWDWPAAERELRQALELNPNYAITHYWYSRYLIRMGRYEEALAESKRALELDPLNLSINNNVSRAYYYLRQYDATLDQCQKTLEIDSTFWVAHHVIGLVYERKGMYKEAIATFQKVISLSEENPSTLASLGEAYARAGKEGEARAIIAKLKERAAKEYISPLDLAFIYAALGDKDETFKLLDRAYAEHVTGLPAIKGDPALDDIRSDQRYIDLMHRLGLEP